MRKAKLSVAITFIALSAVASLAAQRATVDSRMNLDRNRVDPKDYYNWSAGDQKVNDTFDPKLENHGTLSGASVKHSTAEFDKAVLHDTPDTKKGTIPTGLRGLLLYPVAPIATKIDDDLRVTEEGKALVIWYIHRGVAYKATTDNSKNLDVTTSFQKATVGDNVGGVFVLKPGLVKAGGDPQKMADLDWSKVSFSPDVAAPDASRTYTGKLKASYKGGILEIKGNLTQKK